MVEVTPSARERPSVAFGPSSLGEVPPPTLEQIVLRARVRLGERGRLAGQLLFGAGLAFIRERTGSVYPPMVVHGLFNAVALILAVTT